MGKIKKHLNIAFKIKKEFGIKIFISYFLKDFLFRKNNYLGKKMYKKNYDLYKNELKKNLIQCQNYDDNIENIKNDSKIFIFWWQGEENMPSIVKECLASVLKYKKNHEVIIINNKNVKEYCPDIPHYIYEKVEKKIISLTHFSDIVRMSLLYNHGGIWMDATILLDDYLPNDIYEKSFWTINHGLYSNWHVCKGKWTGFFIAASKNHPAIKFIKDNFYNYWKDHNVLLCYLLIDCYIALLYENNLNFKNEIDQIHKNNENLYFIDEHGNEIFNQDVFLKLNTTIFKLHYKRDFIAQKNNQLTFFGKMINTIHQ